MALVALFGPQINERVLDFLLLSIKEGIVEVIQLEVHEVVKVISKERMCERLVEQIVFEASVLVLLIKGTRQPSPQELIQQRIVAQLVDIVVPPIKEEIAYAVQQPSPAEHIQERIEPPQMVEEVLEVVQILLQKRMSERTVELIMDVPMPQMLEERDSRGKVGLTRTSATTKRAGVSGRVFRGGEVSSS